MLRRTLLSSCALALALAAPVAQAAEWSDNSFHLWYGPKFAEPGVAADVSKTVLTFTHASGYKFGSNYLNLDLLYSSSKDPVRGVETVQSVGAAEFYGVYRHTLSLGRALDTKRFSFGPVRDLGIEAGVDANTKQNGFAARKIMPVAGLSLALAVPGFWNVSVLANKEWNTNALPGAARQSVEFDVTAMFATAWAVPVAGPVSFEGFGLVNLPKGNDGFGAATKTELLFHPKVMVELGGLFDSKGYQLGAGWQYWVNKFGSDHNALPGALESALFFEAAIHL
jgi:hypothetical protein